MHIDLQTLAEQAHVHRNTISRAPGRAASRTSCAQALRVIKAATDLNGDLNRALFWYRTEPLSVFGYKTAGATGLGRSHRRCAALRHLARGRRRRMILTDLGPITAYRMHPPKWASAPTSGAGAAAHGGRANRPGTPAFYLALEADTAVREYQQVSPLMPPGTLVSYTVNV